MQIVSYNGLRLCLGVLVSLCEYFCQYIPKIAHLPVSGLPGHHVTDFFGRIQILHTTNK